MAFKNLSKEIRDFPSSYFTWTMSSGILALALNKVGLLTLSDVLFWFANISFVLLLLINISRVLMFSKSVQEDLTSHTSGPGFLSFVAACSILGIGYVQLKQLSLLAIILLVTGLWGWVLILYSFLLGTTLKNEKPSFKKGMSGSWLLIVVSTVSIAILTAKLVPQLPVEPGIAAVVSLLLWLLGILFYLIFVTLIIYRLNFFPVKAGSISPSFWLDAGAAASLALGGLTISKETAKMASLPDFAPTIKLIVLFSWAAASWWIVLLVFQELWRHYKIGFRYSAGYWSLVFPLGMYALANFEITTGMDISYAKHLGRFFTYSCGILWVIIFVAMLFNFFRTFSAEEPSGNSV